MLDTLSTAAAHKLSEIYGYSFNVDTTGSQGT
jgi:hypothetical protein